MAVLKKVVALCPFYDREAGVSRKEGESFEVTAKRLRELNACGTEQGGRELVAEQKAAGGASK